MEESALLEKNNNNPKLIPMNVADNGFDDNHLQKDTDIMELSQQPPSLPQASDASSPQNSTDTKYTRATSPPLLGSLETLGSQRQDRILERPSDTDSKPENDVYNFTDDQRRAMLELIAQKQEDFELLEEEPPEYNVKGRIQQLNAELANDPTPVERDREHRVGFKPEIVDMVAPPPPDYSDEDSQQNTSREGHQTELSTPDPHLELIGSKQAITQNSHDSNKKQFVVERDGQFSVVSAKDLSPAEVELYMNESIKEKKAEKQCENIKTRDQTDSHRGRSAGSLTSGNNTSYLMFPRPPARPRPTTALLSTRRSQLSSHTSHKLTERTTNFSNPLTDFTYHSPYAMTLEQKEEAKERARQVEEDRKEKERKEKDEIEERRRENDSAFQFWLAKKEEDRKRHGRDRDIFKSEHERKEENQQSYQAWLKEKKVQEKKEKLLKRRQQQEKAEAMFLRSPEECQRAFKEWLKRKAAASKKEDLLEKHMSRLYRNEIKRSQKIQALIRALKESQKLQLANYYNCHY